MPQKRPITKFTLYYQSVLKLALMIGGVGVLLFSIGLVFLFRSTTTFTDLLLLSIAGPLYLTLILTVILSPPALRGLYLLAKQEKFLGFCFRVEMENDQITKGVYQSSSWFIMGDSSTIIAVRRDYIVRLEKLKIIKGRHGNRYRITLVGADGKKQRLTGNHASIGSLQKWFREKPEIDSERNVSDDKRENQNQ